MLEFRFEGAVFIYFDVGFVLLVQQVLSRFYVISTIDKMWYEYLCGVLVEIRLR